MPRFELAQRFVDRSQLIQSLTELRSILDRICREMGFHYYALVHHANLRRPSPQVIRLEKYPESVIETAFDLARFRDLATLATNIGQRPHHA